MPKLSGSHRAKVMTQSDPSVLVSAANRRKMFRDDEKLMLVCEIEGMKKHVISRESRLKVRKKGGTKVCKEVSMYGCS